MYTKAQKAQSAAQTTQYGAPAPCAFRRLTCYLLNRHELERLVLETHFFWPPFLTLVSVNQPISPDAEQGV